ncbi:hypothetical protein GTZ99_13725 [Novosphingobium sp. FSY-8]|uniref:Uncharacterized protein n=1 Tax=Novosphingobium ovatum TaxID=1908523 RepID=A0ABW9XGL6_9SPHN|nr:hypothetical protein [Novosphingobium ovatum]NBC37609.1 hypothetical protein [Novosphingobium ovatum]
MTKTVPQIASRAALAAVLLSALALAGCGRSDQAGDAVSAETVEIPADEALSALPSAAAPVVDASAAAVDADPVRAAADRALAAASDIQAAEAEQEPAPADRKTAN